MKMGTKLAGTENLRNRSDSETVLESDNDTKQQDYVDSDYDRRRSEGRARRRSKSEERRSSMLRQALLSAMGEAGNQMVEEEEEENGDNNGGGNNGSSGRGSGNSGGNDGNGRSSGGGNGNGEEAVSDLTLEEEKTVMSGLNGNGDGDGSSHPQQHSQHHHHHHNRRHHHDNGSHTPHTPYSNRWIGRKNIYHGGSSSGIATPSIAPSNAISDTASVFSDYQTNKSTIHKIGKMTRRTLRLITGNPVGSTAFVSFRSLAVASIAGQCMTYRHPLKMVVSPAPHQDDIIWPNICQPMRQVHGILLA